MRCDSDSSVRAEELIQNARQQAGDHLRDHRHGQAQQDQDQHRPKHPRRGLVRVPGGLAPRRTQEHDAGEPDEGGRGDSADQGEEADGEEGARLRPSLVANPHCNRPRYISHSLTKPFSGGRAAIATAPTIMAPRRPGHALHQPAELLHVLGARPVQDAAGGEEHQPLHEGVIPDVKQAGRDTQHGHEQAKPLARPHSPTPRARPISPMFSMLE